MSEHMAQQPPLARERSILEHPPMLACPPQFSLPGRTIREYQQNRAVVNQYREMHTQAREAYLRFVGARVPQAAPPGTTLQQWTQWHLDAFNDVNPQPFFYEVLTGPEYEGMMRDPVRRQRNVHHESDLRREVHRRHPSWMTIANSEDLERYRREIEPRRRVFARGGRPPPL